MVPHRTLPQKVSLYDIIIILKTLHGGENSEPPTVLSSNLTLFCVLTLQKLYPGLKSTSSCALTSRALLGRNTAVFIWKGKNWVIY